MAAIHGGMGPVPEPLDLIAPVRSFGSQTVDLRREVVVMAVVNRTRDSFHDRGRTFALPAALEAARSAVAEGAQLVDVGAVPFSPDAEPVSEADEIARLVPVVETLAAEGVAVSVDTWRSAVARACLDAGAVVVNDTSGLFDPELAGTVAQTSAQLVLTHSVAAPGAHLRRPHYEDVVAEVLDFLAERMERARSAGVPAERLLVDPGPDLNKNALHSLEICRRLAEFTSLRVPVLAAVSHKDFIGETLDVPADARGTGTAVATALCVERGARVVRAHDVRQAREAAAMTMSVLGIRPPATLWHNVTPG